MITFNPIGFVRNTRTTPEDDYWGDIVSRIELAPQVPDAALQNIELFSHLEIIYHFNQVRVEDVVYAGHPRGNTAWPEMGIFAQRKKDRPNAIGLCTVQLVERRERQLLVKLLDAIDGTPVLDIKPVMRQFMPQGTIVQPEWADELMEHYWK